MLDFLFICKDRSSGDYKEGKYGLWNSANFVVDFLQKSQFKAEIISVFDANCIDREIHKNKPKVVVLEALWVTPEKLTQLVKLHPRVRWIVRIHSKLPFLANEGIALQWLNGYKRIPRVTITGNNLEFVQDMNACNYRLEYLPNVYIDKINYQRPMFNRQDLHIGCFGSLRPMKNHLIQAVAAIDFANFMGYNLKFHINSSRHEQRGDNVLKNLIALFENNPEHTLVHHGWLSHKDFLGLVYTMDIGMQVSYSESFNIVSADFVRMNIPIVTSSEVSFNTSFLWADPNDRVDIVSKLTRAKHYSSWLNWHSNTKLDSYNKTAKQIWIKKCSSIL
jgi:hypothetical protein